MVRNERYFIYRDDLRLGREAAHERERVAARPHTQPACAALATTDKAKVKEVTNALVGVTASLDKIKVRVLVARV